MTQRIYPPCAFELAGKNEEVLTIRTLKRGHFLGAAKTTCANCFVTCYNKHPRQILRD